MWWADLLWGFWNGLTAWIVLIVHVFGGWEQFPSTTRREAETGTTSAFCSVPAPLFWVLWAGEGEGATNPRGGRRSSPLR